MRTSPQFGRFTCRAKVFIWPFFIAFNVSPIVQKIEELLGPIIAEEGMELLEVFFGREYGRTILRLYIDRVGEVVGVADCSRLSHAIEDLLEVEGVIKQVYDLEVSSPGLNRPLKKKAHFERVLEKTIRVQTIEPLEGRRNYKGVLKKVADEKLEILIDGKIFIVPLNKVQKANLEHFE